MTQNPSTTQAAQPFPIRRGLNILDWTTLPLFFNQPPQIHNTTGRPWLTIPSSFDRDEAARIARRGFDHVRFMFHEAHLFTPDGDVAEEGFGELRHFVTLCIEAGLRVIAVPATAREHRNMDKNIPHLFDDPDACKRFARMWSRMAREFLDISDTMLAFEFMNEPIAPDSASWNRVALAAWEAVRAVAPRRSIVLPSNYFSVWNTVADLTPPDDRYWVLSFHYYLPMLITHRGIPWWPGGAYAGPVSYPGIPATRESVRAHAPEVLEKLKDEDTAAFDRSLMRHHFTTALDAAKRMGAPLNCGEFGCTRHIDPAIRRAYLADVFGLFEELGISWTFFDYRGKHFGLCDEDGADTEIVDLAIRA